jgi:hypothetical protein
VNDTEWDKWDRVPADRRLTLAYVMNKMGGGTIAVALAERVGEIV